MPTPLVDLLGETALVRDENPETSEIHAALLAHWREAATERAATFNRTAGRKAAFHYKRLEAITGDSSSATKKRAVAETAEAHWREHEGRGAELVGQLIEGLAALTTTPISRAASWAVWDDSDAGAHWYEGLEELSVLIEGHIIPTTGAVFLGLNAGPAASADGMAEAWAAFHREPDDGNHPRGHIRHLAEHLRDTPFRGSYMTSFYKNMPDVDEHVLKALLDTASAPDKKAMTSLMGLIIRDETTVFSIDIAQTTALALGGRAANLTRTAMRDWDVIELPDYTSNIKTEAFRAGVDDALAITHPDFVPHSN